MELDGFDRRDNFREKEIQIHDNGPRQTEFHHTEDAKHPRRNLWSAWRLSFSPSILKSIKHSIYGKVTSICDNSAYFLAGSTSRMARKVANRALFHIALFILKNHRRELPEEPSRPYCSLIERPPEVSDDKPLV